MLLQATNIIPSTFSGTGAGTIDVAQGLTASWQVNGSTPMTAYGIKICKNDTASTQLLDTGIVPLANPFYGTDHLGNVRRFTATHISAETLSGAGIINGYENGYKLYIIQYSGDASAYETLEPYSPALFITRLTPTIQLNGVPPVVSAKKLTVTASAQNITPDNAIEWVQWQWALRDNISEPFYDTGKIYGTGELKSTYDGLFSGTAYSVKCTIFTEAGQQATSDWNNFEVDYETGEYYGSVKACNTAGTNAVTVSFPGATPIVGKVYGLYSIYNEKLNIPGSSSITWDKVGNSQMSFPSTWSFVWDGFVRSGKTVTVFSIQTGGTTIDAIVSPDGVTVKRGASPVAYFPQKNNGNGNYTIVVQPGLISLKYKYVYGLYPGRTLPIGRALPVLRQSEIHSPNADRCIRAKKFRRRNSLRRTTYDKLFLACHGEAHGRSVCGGNGERRGIQAEF